MAPEAQAGNNDDMMILVVDDRPINRRLLADQLGSLGYQCVTANDGIDALNVLSKQHIDIVLSDVNMPNMDGYRLTQRIRQLSLTLPVIGVTANALAEEKQRCLESGMDSCLSKPVTLDVLKQTLTVYAARVRKGRNNGSSVSPGARERRGRRRLLFVRRAQRDGREVVQQGDVVFDAQLHHRRFLLAADGFNAAIKLLAISVTRKPSANRRSTSLSFGDRRLSP